LSVQLTVDYQREGRAGHNITDTMFTNIQKFADLFDLSNVLRKNKLVMFNKTLKMLRYDNTADSVELIQKFVISVHITLLFFMTNYSLSIKYCF